MIEQQDPVENIPVAHQLQIEEEKKYIQESSSSESQIELDDFLRLKLG